MDRTTPKNYLIACGTSDYTHLDDSGQLASVRDDIARVVDVLTHHFGYERVLSDVLNLNPTREALTLRFAQWLQSEAVTAIDRVVFYYSGHGVPSLDEHYLFLKDSDLALVGQSALSTVELVKPLGNPKVEVKQILYIIDTCFAGQGSIEIVEHAEKILDKCSIDAKYLLSVHVIAASRTQQTASPSLFSIAFAKVLMELGEQGDRQNSPTGILPSALTEAIGNEITDPEQHVNHRKSGSEARSHFFHFVAPTLRTWELHRNEWVSSFVAILGRRLEASLFFINSFLLAQQQVSQFVLDERTLMARMRQLGSLPVNQEICPLLLCSEWCRVRFESDDENGDPDLAIEIQNWQREVMSYRPDADLGCMQMAVENLAEQLREVLAQEHLRIQIEIERERDQKKNTGQGSGAFLLSVSLCTEGQLIPLGQFAKKHRLEPSDGRRLEGLLACLQENELLPGLIRQARYSFASFVDITVDLAVEIFLPFEVLRCPLDQIEFTIGFFPSLLGHEYPIFINSYERYFDRLHREAKDAVARKKDAIWTKRCRDPQPCPLELHTSTPSRAGTEFNAYDLFLGANPSEPVLKLIVTSLPIAVWSRDNQVDMTQILAEADWNTWPEQVKRLRMDNNQANVTFFWDDCYPKPSVRTRSFNTSVVG